MTPEYYAELLSIMADDSDMLWTEIEEVMFHLKTKVEFVKVE